ncbi:MAG: helicase-related protein [Candidatus Syntropharchaeales archaeon]
MAGLLIKELQYRRMAERILIIAPGHLKYQWQREMKERFNTRFTIINRGLMSESFWGENIWDELDLCIAPIDFLKQDDVIQTLKSARWDLVIVDEAHKMSAYGRRTRRGVKIDRTKRYRVGEIISKNATHLLFLTATPHRGDEENFRLFLDLLRPQFFSKTELLKESVENKDNPLFVRRLKEDMKDFSGKKLFTPRNVITVTFPLTNDENDLYIAVTNYVRNYFDRAKENRSITFAMMILQRRLTSSVFAVHRSLERRKKRLEELLRLPEKIKQDDEYDILNRITDEDLEEMEEEERWRIEKKLEDLTIAKNIDEVRMEIDELERLIELAKRVMEAEIESKLVKLRDEILKNLEGRKLLIFTEFKDTLTYLEERLTSWGYRVNTIHGGLNMDSRIDAENRFRNETQIMIATEAAGEGINLQFCSLMVNYDIPWNPNRLEQRMGRIHRYGQDKEVFIYNMVSSDTREGQILERLFEKLNLMREALGSDRVFDIIGDLIPGTSLDEVLRDAITGQRRIEEIYEDYIDAINEQEVKGTIDRIFMTSLATRHIDYSGLIKERHEADENRLMPEYIEDYFLMAFEKFGGSFEKLDSYYRINSVPFELRRLNDDYSFKSRYGKVSHNYARITFDKEVAKSHTAYEYVAPGHPLLEAVNQRVLDEPTSSECFAVFVDEADSREGVIWFIIGEVRDGREEVAGRRIFSLYQSTGGDMQIVNPSILWDLSPLDNYSSNNLPEDILDRKEEIEDYAVTNLLFPYLSEIQEKRRREAAIKEKYGLRSLEYLLQESNDRLLHYYEEARLGKDMSMPILNEERRKEDLERKIAELKDEIRFESNLTVSNPEMIGAAVVIPSNKIRVSDKAITTSDMHHDKRIEETGMKVAIEFEQKNGWMVEDVHTENLGFDLRSVMFDEDGSFKDIRYIEVKARAREGGIRLSANEWKKAKRFKDQYWLYIVQDAGTDSPKLTRIQNPYQRFKIDEDIYATGYIIPFERLGEL